MDEAVKAMQKGIEEDSGITASEATSEARDMAIAGNQFVFFGEPIDTKYEFLAWKKGDRHCESTFTEDDGIIFRAKDNALLPTLTFYQSECERIGASKEQLYGIGLLIMRVEKWREENLKLCKVPD